MKCPRCNRDNRPIASFCDGCGTPLELLRGNDRPAAYPKLQQSLADALARETATGEILRVIGSSPNDAQPVFETIAKSGVTVCAALGCAVFVVDGDMLRVAATQGVRPGRVRRFEREYPIPLDAEIDSAQTVRERSIFHLADIEHNPNATMLDREYARIAGYRTRLMVPMIRGDKAVGLIAVTREAPTPFADHEIELLKTFADQAVIAIENVRLFNETKEALEQQTATSEILRVISSSPTDIQPALDAVAANAARVCGATDAVILRVEGQETRRVAHSGAIPLILPEMRDITPGSPGGRAILECRSIHIHDAFDAEFAREYPETAAVVRDAGWRTILVVPLVREGAAIGVISIRRTEVRPFTDKEIALLQTFADQAVIAIENVRLFTELQEKNRALTDAHARTTESLAQQTATAEILRVISSSPTDVQPVLDAIAERSVRLCGALFSSVYRYDGELIHMRAHFNYPAAALERSKGFFPTPPHRRLFTARAILERTAVHVPDVRQDAEFMGQELVEEAGFRAVLSVPMLRHGAPIGAVTVWHAEVGAFTDKHIVLLQTFADQAVIAIENVRLFTELQARNRDLTATSEILRVIARSPTDVGPVFDTIAESATRLCEGSFGFVSRFDGGMVHFIAGHNLGSAALDEIRRSYPLAADRDTINGLALVDRRVVHVTDVEHDPDVPRRGRELARIFGFRSVVAVPMVRDTESIGSISVARDQAKPFTDDQIALLKTFADQAVIAIENVRLFTELQTSNRELTTALDTQTATSDILRVISRSQTDVQPVFDAIVASAVRLLEAFSGTLTRLVGDQIELVAFTSTDPAGDTTLKAAYPRSVHSGDPHAQAVRNRAPLNIPDAQTDSRLPEATHTYARARGWRSAGVVPMLRHDEAIGAIGITRPEAGGFTEDEIALLQTFGDQAVIAIENARLLTELQARTQELTRSVEQLTALGDVGRAVSSSLDLDTVLSTIVGRAVQLSGTDGGTIFEYDESAEEFTARATLNTDESQSALLRATRLRRGEGAVGQMAVTRQPIQIPDIAAEGAYESRIRAAMLDAGTRSVLAIPLLHEEQLVGGLVVTRRTPGAFDAEIVALLQTFATQSALAIQNARLFREIADKSRQLEAASQHKSEFLANMSHELRTPLNAIIGFSEVLSERMFGELNEKQEEYLKDIHASGQHLLSLINDILDLSKIEAGKMELELSDFDLLMTIDNALMLVRERATRRGIELHRTVDERLGQVQADERKIRQVLLNLLSNAIKFTPEGGRIAVEAKPLDGSVEVSVTDTGVGIAPEDQEAVFEEFRQVGTAEKKIEGTGLGLALSRKFIELHGGRIWVKSQVRAGSTFTFTVPVRRGE